MARPRYVENADVLSVKYGPETGSGSGTADGNTGRFAGLIQPLTGAGGTLSIGEGFVIQQTSLSRASANYRLSGLALDAGTNQLVLTVNNSGSVQMRNLTAWGHTASVATDYTYGAQGSSIYLRIVRLSSTTWRGDVSPDGVSWILGNTLATWAFEPTHVGVTESNWNTATPSVTSYEFIRRVSGVS